MKMLYILNTTKRVNNFSYSSMLAAQDLGFEFHIAGNWTGYSNASEIESDEKKYGIKIHQIDFVRAPYHPKNIKAYKQVVELIKKEKFDIIHCNTPVGGVIGRLAGKRCGIKHIIYQAHGFHFFKGAPIVNWLVYYPIEKFLARFTDVLITINKEDYELAQKKMPAKHVCYVPGVGIDLDKIRSVQANRNEIRKSMGVPEDCILITSVGELSKRKNHQVVINALAKLKNPKVHYAVAGQGPLLNYLTNLVKKLGIEQQVHFLGFRRDIYQIYKASDIAALPSLQEGLSIALMEAMAAGLPCIVSEIRGNSDMIDRCKGGFLCNPTNSTDFAEAIKNMRLEMGENNQNTIKKYSIQIVKQKMMDLYKLVIQTSRIV